MPLHKADQVNVVSDKVKLTKEQAEIIKEYVEMWDDENIVKFRVTDNGSLSQIPLDTLIRALYIWYDVEKTVEERLLEHFNGLHCDWYLSGMRETLNIIGMKVKGINS